MPLQICCCGCCVRCWPSTNIGQHRSTPANAGFLSLSSSRFPPHRPCQVIDVLDTMRKRLEALNGPDALRI